MNYEQLLNSIVSLHQRAQAGAAAAVNQFLVVRNWLMGANMIEFEQHGEGRAAYGAKLLQRLSLDLGARQIKGCSPDMLERMRQLYLEYPQLRSCISAPLVRKLAVPLPRGKPKISAPLARKSPTGPSPLPPEAVLRLSWSQLIEFLSIADPWKRAFYENECLKGSWSKRQLQRQIGSLLYERTGLSTDKKKVIQRARDQAGEAPLAANDLIRDPYVLEFTGLAERPEFNESELETALLDDLQAFLLELGTGFCFEARQMRITMDNEHDYVDLVFYHRILRFHLILDLKVRPFKHGDAGQMNFYLNYFKNRVMAPGDNPPVGIILCSDRRQTKVEFATAGMDNRLFVSRYLVALPKPEQLEALIEADRAQFESATRDGQARRRGNSRHRSRAGKRGGKP